jgi:hypothetical protein
MGTPGMLMRLTEEQSRELLRLHGVYVTEACDKCTRILGHVRYTIKDQPGEWCSRLCRDGVEHSAGVLDQYRERVENLAAQGNKLAAARELALAEVETKRAEPVRTRHLSFKHESPLRKIP